MQRQPTTCGSNATIDLWTTFLQCRTKWFTSWPHGLKVDLQRGLPKRRAANRLKAWSLMNTSSEHVILLEHWIGQRLGRCYVVQSNSIQATHKPMLGSLGVRLFDSSLIRGLSCWIKPWITVSEPLHSMRLMDYAIVYLRRPIHSAASSMRRGSISIAPWL